MKINFVLILCIITNYAFGQINLIDSIVIKSSSGYYDFKLAKTKSYEEVLIIKHNTSQNNYIISSYKANHYLGEKSQKEVYKKVKNTPINMVLIDSLYFSLNKNQKPTFGVLRVSQQDFEKLITKKLVRKVAKKYKFGKIELLLNNLIKEDRVNLLNGLKNKDTLNLFLSKSFDTTSFSIVTDQWNEMHISISVDSKTIIYQGVSTNILRQPWYNFTDTSGFLPKPILNLSINTFLLKLMPSNFFLRKTISNNALINQYIAWYLLRRDIGYPNY